MYTRATTNGEPATRNTHLNGVESNPRRSRERVHVTKRDELDERTDREQQRTPQTKLEPSKHSSKGYRLCRRRSKRSSNDGPSHPRSAQTGQDDGAINGSPNHWTQSAATHNNTNGQNPPTALGAPAPKMNTQLGPTRAGQPKHAAMVSRVMVLDGNPAM